MIENLVLVELPRRTLCRGDNNRSPHPLVHGRNKRHVNASRSRVDDRRFDQVEAVATTQRRELFVHAVKPKALCRLKFLRAPSGVLPPAKKKHSLDMSLENSPPK